ncbi:MAG: hypothetical protein QGM50_11835 [Anaerolineae bacterium]|nr:hypothetical protein [Anaerolineae bacterium]MDK1119461.1 hypothetical protein [Anaerolineae bacterium]
MPDKNKLYLKYKDQMEDFWSRRFNTPKFEQSIRIFGHPVTFHSNHEQVLKSAALAEQMYSTSAPQPDLDWDVYLTVHNLDPKPAAAPKRLVDQVKYSGADNWLSIDLGEWGNCFVDMERGQAYAVLSPALAEKPEQVCLLLLNTILTNFLTRHGYSMLHASALIYDENILLLQASHGTGKSTTALRLLEHGYKLLSDGQVYICQRENKLWMGGFPAGSIKLRSDMLPFFPTVATLSREEPVRSEIKHRVDIKDINPLNIQKEMIRIKRIEYCLLERWDKSKSVIEPLSEAELWPEIMLNSLLYDTPELWNENLNRIDLMLGHANLHRLKIGTSENEIIKTVNGLW